ncbi:hypothetical protein [Qipengyuania mesophila]|uniref:hypothetical protein n=1 Tax=Qipengyuania mesophila TaxID=2867246 RepID=UPI0035133AC4
MAPVLETRSDCSRCAALCCIAYPSEEMPGFSAAKQAGQPCPKLGADALCTIYARRAEEGFAGCIRFECFGAGQHVVQSLFEGRDWRGDGTLLGPMVEAFLAMRPVSDLAYLVERALGVAPTDPALLQLREELADIAGSREALADSARIARAGQAVRRAYASLDPASLQNS